MLTLTEDSPELKEIQDLDSALYELACSFNLSQMLKSFELDHKAKILEIRGTYAKALWRVNRVQVFLWAHKKRKWHESKNLRTVPLLEKARNALTATKDLVVAKFSGKPVLLSEDAMAARQAICGACKYYNHVKDECTGCGCGIKRDLINKAMLATSKCPGGYWPQVQPEDLRE